MTHESREVWPKRVERWQRAKRSRVQCRRLTIERDRRAVQVKDVYLGLFKHLFQSGDAAIHRVATLGRRNWDSKE